MRASISPRPCASRTALRAPPVVLMTMGLDSTKEELLTFEQNFLARGMAILAFDGPGQGEAEYDFPIRADYETVTGIVIDWVEANRPDLDRDRIGIWGISLGGYYAPRSAAFEKRIKACIANCGPWDFGALWDALPELTRLAFVARSHSATDDEGAPPRPRALPRWRRRQSHMSAVRDRGRPRPPLPARGRRAPCRASKRAGRTLVIEDGNHVAHNRFYKYRARSADWMAAQLGAAAK